jgi:phosphatidylglycerol lysyltransferase
MSSADATSPSSLFARAGKPLLSVALFCLASIALYRELHDFELKDIVRATKAVRFHQLSWALLLTFISYTLLSFYDFSGLRLLKKSISYFKVSFESFCSYALSHNLGFPIFTGGAVRLRLLGNWGVSAGEVANIVAYNSLFLWFGFSFVLGSSMVVAPSMAFMPKAVIFWLRPLGWLLLVLPCVLPLLMHYYKVQSFSLFGFSLQLPRGSTLLTGIGIAVVDWIVSAMVLYVLLPRPEAVSVWFFIKVFLASQALGLLSHVPGGIGVFEGTMIALLKPYFDAAPLLGSLLLYRMVYYLLPLFLASFLLGAYEVRQHREKFFAAGKYITKPVAAISPIFLTIQVAAAGVLLIASGAVPPNEERFSVIADLFPLTAIEFSHFISSLIGVVLLMLAQGLHKRVSAAYYGTVGLLALAIVLALVKGFDIDEAIFLMIVLIAVYPARDFFYRHSKLIDTVGESSWWMLIIGVLGGLIGILFFCFKDVNYEHSLWWQLTAEAHVSRSLRATLGVSVFVFALGLSRLFSPSIHVKEVTTSDDIDALSSILDTSSTTAHYVSLLGDKQIHFNEDRSGFVMYGIEGKSVVSLGDPVAEESKIPELIWSFYEMSRRIGGKAVFYEVSEKYLWVYVEAGLSVLKLGEEAVVPLATFKIEGKKRATLRHQRNRCIREGLTFEVIGKEDVPAYLPQLKAISDLWLQDKNTREKGFSLGFFNESYLKQFPAALVRKHGELVGFANILASKNKHELSLDLMRYIPHAAPGIMDFLFTELMLWGRDQGYETFNLGMAPFSGFENRPFAPLWNRLADVVFKKGERFYNFRGLRNFKDKYDPIWSPRYLIYPGGISLPFVLRDIASLISGGVKGVFAK